MKKIRFLALTLIVSLMVMGFGYAAWTDNLVVNNTVATGELDVKFIKEVNAESSGVQVGAVGAEYVIPDVEIVGENADTVKITLSNLYPGAWAAFRLKGVNVGTIPVNIESIQADFSGNLELLKDFTYEGGFSIDSNGDNLIDDSTGKFGGSLAEIGKDFNEKISKIKKAGLEPNGKGSFYFETPKTNANSVNPLDGKYIIIHFSSNAGNDTQKKSLSFTITTNFKQHNQ